jgi:hypothetical protein
MRTRAMVNQPSRIGAELRRCRSSRAEHAVAAQDRDGYRSASCAACRKIVENLVRNTHKRLEVIREMLSIATSSVVMGLMLALSSEDPDCCRGRRSLQSDSTPDPRDLSRLTGRKGFGSGDASTPISLARFASGEDGHASLSGRRHDSGQEESCEEGCQEGREEEGCPEEGRQEGREEEVREEEGGAFDARYVTRGVTNANSPRGGRSPIDRLLFFCAPK